MLEIVCRNPDSLTRARVIVDKILRYNPKTGEAEIVYRTKAASEAEDVEYEVLANSRKPESVA